MSAFPWRTAASPVRIPSRGRKIFCSAYIENDSSLTLYGLFCDNGRTGTDFERPEFENLMEAVKHGEVDCIVVKDLSRFGRNYLEVGEYLEIQYRMYSEFYDYDSQL